MNVPMFEFNLTQFSWQDQVAGLGINLPKNIDLMTYHPSLTPLLDKLPGMVFVAGIDTGWSMQYLSQGCLSITGYSSKELVRFQGAAYNALIHWQDLPLLLLGITVAIAQRQPYEIKYRISTESGQQKRVCEKGKGVFGSDQRLLRIEGFITDITSLEQK
jgi:PAS domain S-box-containing protein